MAPNAVTAATPRYLLLDAGVRLGPPVLQPKSGSECTATFGFSSKEYFDRFCKNTESALTPYPLVKVFLRNEANSAAPTRRVMVLDAIGPNEQQFDATTIKAVLNAHENEAPRVTTTHCLTRDPDTDRYRIDELEGAE